MKHYYYLHLICAVLVLAGSPVSGLCAAEQKHQPNPALAWDALEKSISYNHISRFKARNTMQILRPRLSAYFEDHGGTVCGKSEWIFPLKGYAYRAIDRYYVYHGYDFFGAKRHKDHPAYDIFIRDRNRDCKDDKTRQPVKILSVSCGVVVAKGTGWVPGSDRRGGNYLWVYDPCTQGLLYYAHFKTISAKVGDILAPGDELGTVGRSGKNAYKRRSPTHLHLMYLKYPATGYPYPVRFYDELLQAKLAL